MPVLGTTVKTSSGFTVNWSAPTSGGPVASYTLFIYGASAYDLQNMFTDLSASTTSKEVTGKNADSPYSFSLWAQNAGGYSQNVGEQVRTLPAGSTPPPPPPPPPVTPPPPPPPPATFTTIDVSGTSVGGSYYEYSFNCTITSQYKFDGFVDEPRGDAYMYIYDSAGTTMLASNDDASPGVILSSTIDYFACTAGTTYKVRVKDYYGSTCTARIIIWKR